MNIFDILNSNTKHMTFILTQDPQNCVDCFTHIFSETTDHALICIGTALIAAIIRHFEKKKIKKDLNK